ncbi:MAG TPA: hypothetical protein VNZ86_01560, partial [Bacteroidia bacterium]|nr:hypothetical protein [Bacteroidia bacterium]
MQDKKDKITPDQLYHQAFSSLEADPSPGIWEKVEKELDDNTRRRPLAWWWWGVFLILLTGLSGGAWWIYASKTEAKRIRQTELPVKKKEEQKAKQNGGGNSKQNQNLPQHQDEEKRQDLAIRQIDTSGQHTSNKQEQDKVLNKHSGLQPGNQDREKEPKPAHTSTPESEVFNSGRQGTKPTPTPANSKETESKDSKKEVGFVT